jgi:hypothetical protein
MANQYIAQMEEVVREAIFGNVGTLISFRVGPTDAPYLAKEFMPTFEEDDLINLDKFQVYTKMAIDGVTSPPFSAQTLPPYSQKEGFDEQVREFTRKRYAKPREEIEDWIANWDKKSSKSKKEITEEKLGDIKIDGVEYYPVVGTDQRNWYIQKDKSANNNNEKSDQNSNKNNDKSKEKNRKEPKKKLLKEHLQGIASQLKEGSSQKGEKNHDKQKDQQKDQSPKQNNTDQDKNGNHIIKEGEKISLNGRNN